MSNDKRITIDFCDNATREAAADFLLSLIKTGLTFNADQNHDSLVITLTGGY